MAEQNESSRNSILDDVLKRSLADPNAPIDLRKKTRLHENIIQVFLFLCGVVSILTTIGIVWVLLSESLVFFNRNLWEDTNRTIAAEIDADQTSFRAGATGRELHSNTTIRISDEVMFLNEYIPNDIEIDVTGTSAGFDIFCEGNSQINEASRVITTEELEICRANNVEPVALQVGTDAIAIVVNENNDFATDMTAGEIALLFGGAVNWSEIRPEWPNETIVRFIPGTDSGTFDYFVEEIYDGDDSDLVGVDATRISSDELVTSEDDNQLVRGVSDNEFAVGFFGYSYFAENEDRLNAIAINGITPTIETVDDGTYLLGRPLFLYVNQTVLQDEAHVAMFINYYLQTAPQLLDDLGFFATGEDAINTARTAYLDAIDTSVATGDDGLVSLPAVSIRDVSGNISITGSSTVFPLTDQIASNYEDEGYLPVLEVERGVDDTIAVPHTPGISIEIGDRVTLGEFFTGWEWQPAISDFGILPLIYGTLAASIIAMFVALPLGMGAAIYLSEYAPDNVRNTIKPILEILAGIPTVVYGYFALTFMTPLLQGIFGDVVQIYNSASAGIVVGILIIPMVSSLSEDALSAVPRGLREASYGLGATKLETTIKVVIPAALSGIMAAFIIAISRAIGETMIVAIAAGAGPQNNVPGLLGDRGLAIIFEPAETMTGHIARISGGDLSYDSIDYNSIFAIGLMLFVITLVLNLINNAIIRRFREAY
ncbi:MAG: phosphate ABC transporter permease subunit PstC [Chloroflexota bacterium]